MTQKTKDTVYLRFDVPRSLHSAIKSIASGEGKTIKKFAMALFRGDKKIAKRERENRTRTGG